MNSSLLLGTKTHQDIEQLLEKKKEVVVSGLSNETAKALLVAQILSFKDFSILLVTENEERKELLRHWCGFFGVMCEELFYNKEEGISASLLQKILLLYTRKGGGVFLATREFWDATIPRIQKLQEHALILKPGQSVSFTHFVEDLIERGYIHSNDNCLYPGEYRRQGDVLDIFPVQLLHPIRVLFALETVEKFFIIDHNDALVLAPFDQDLHIYSLQCDESAPLSKQIPEDSLLILDDQDDVPVPKNVKTLRFTAFPESEENHVHVRYLSILKFYTLTDFLNDVRDKLQQEWTLVVVTRRGEELQGIFDEEHIPYLIEGKRKPGVVTLFKTHEQALLPHSIQNPDLKCALLTDREIFSLKKTAHQRSVQKLALDFITSLSAGDFVVHMEHGIGRFEGMTQKMVDGTTREYLEITYAEGDKLFIPVDQADKLSKYVYEDGNEPVLTRLGTKEWKKVTERMRKETQEIAKELLVLYAKRANAKGFAYEGDNKAQEKFEEAFPYQETPGQIKAIEDIKKDMEDPHPMDRLVCGDVGFGKTEVAMRAAFKAVQDGKQVACIAPITILADQHYHNFQDRMKGFDMEIEMLSRFRTQRQQKETLNRLRKGNTHIVIGTHRLLQDDVKFFNLGLVIIDEEQRFGVKQKEKFKSLRASVDILTLTATPIPRTLNLGLHKLRDISTITTPPPGRLPIITEVRKYSDQLIRQAILYEIKRKGQCFVLYNRVETIDAFAEKLRMLVPQATCIVGHGQLKPEELEKRILAFKKGEYDVLVSSTIIENGIDLPRANTLIVNAAECFGLAQLYQLRGRVGRGKVQAHAYFLYHSQKLKDDAKKRLRAIVEACELGSGFQVAMRDLEIRGAGEILGANQSGTMQTVGVSHYMRMLKNAVQELRSGGKERMEEEENVEILLPTEALIPPYYIPDEGERISLYQKLAAAEDEKILSEFALDLREEYGEPPESVQNLFMVLQLKLVCRSVGVLRVKAEENRGVRTIILNLSQRVTAKEVMQLLQGNAKWKISSNTLRITEEAMGAEKLISDIRLLQKAKPVRQAQNKKEKQKE
ncbi:transcription-repair coupling factor [Candidatus Peribacteria bacterium RIFCSPHIGHO2_02_FULL_49_16]|nr:MAG: transcription-repair coupling factor [Candidatus Peribacteria bacterium RIFCSPHIGHO2_01_FULL_49_38]OGJ60002.1 MAG: transcription-repair coupling factor [Candidatus Peribacteria bacterium RIFCSPHIGHO2_02_FULL_49_16]